MNTLSDTLSELYSLLSPCRLCPHECEALRVESQTGLCGLTDKLIVFCTNLHHGEEPPVSGTGGSGTVFFSNCNLRCVYCQNYAFSHVCNGEELTPEELAERMCLLQARGAHNINWVTPTPQIPLAIEALGRARKNGLTIPLVYNCGGYESVEVLKLLEGYVDVYLPDAKYAIESSAHLYSSAPDYPEINRAALAEMYRQVGALQCDAKGIAVKGMCIRHLVLPDNLSGTDGVMRTIADVCGTDVPVSVMRQYFPAHKAHEYPEIARRITDVEYASAIEAAEAAGLENVFIQE